MLYETKNTFCFTVTDEAEKPLCGVTFTIECRPNPRCQELQECQEEQLCLNEPSCPYNEMCNECEECYTVTSNEYGEVIFCDLPVGDYVLTEVSVPDWIEAKDESFAVIVRECEVIVEGSIEPFSLTYQSKFISDFGNHPEHAIGIYNGFDWLELIRITTGSLLAKIPYAGGTASALFNYLTTMDRTDPTKELILEEITKIVKENLDAQDVRQIKGVLNGIKEYMTVDFIPSKASGLRPKEELYRDLKVRYDQMYSFIGWLKEINNSTHGAYLNVFQLAAIQFISITQELALIDPSVSNPLNSDFCNVIRKEAATFKKHGEESIVLINKKRNTDFKFKTCSWIWTMCYKYWIDSYTNFESYTFVRDDSKAAWAACPSNCIREGHHSLYFKSLKETNAAAQADMEKWQVIRHQEIYNELGMEAFYSAMDKLIITPLDYQP